MRDFRKYFKNGGSVRGVWEVSIRDIVDDVTIHSTLFENKKDAVRLYASAVLDGGATIEIREVFIHTNPNFSDEVITK